MIPRAPAPPRRLAVIAAAASARMRALAAVAAMPAGVALLALAVVVGRGPTRLDLLAEPGALHAEPLVAASWAVTGLGGTDFGWTLTIVAVGALAVARLWHAAVALAVAVGVTQLVVDLLKDAVSRPRPEANAHLAEASGFSFPSGHSATSAALFGTLALVALRYAPRHLRAAIPVCALLVVAAVGASRVLLGAHYPSDVLAGWLTGATVAVASLALLGLVRRLARRVAG